MLNGGYEEWLTYYPMLTTNANVLCPPGYTKAKPQTASRMLSLHCSHSYTWSVNIHRFMSLQTVLVFDIIRMLQNSPSVTFITAYSNIIKEKYSSVYNNSDNDIGWKKGC